jgi:Domain of unknown function (DUF4253)
VAPNVGYAALQGLRWQASIMNLADLPEDRPIDVGGVTLPAGKLIRPHLEKVPEAPVLWATNAPLPQPGVVWLDLLAGSAESGLMPVILDSLSGQPNRPWDSGELAPHLIPTPDDLEEAIVFRQRWNMSVPIGLLPPEDRPPPLVIPGRPPRPVPEYEEDAEEREYFLEMVSPWGIGFPGLALAERTPRNLEAYRQSVIGTSPGTIALVSTRRSADVLYQIGWTGAVNHFLQETGATRLSVMLRSWEERFGARLLRLSFDTILLTVERPPSNEASALAIAAEHLAFAGSDVFQSYRQPMTESIRALADTLIDRPTWQFWFD